MTEQHNVELIYQAGPGNGAFIIQCSCGWTHGVAVRARDDAQKIADEHAAAREEAS